MSSASDYSVGSAPGGASYAAPLVGFQLGQMLSNLPDDYFKGTQNARTLAMQQPILGPDGQPTTDIKTIVGELNRRGGGEFAASMLPFLQKQGVLDQPTHQLTYRRFRQASNHSTSALDLDPATLLVLTTFTAIYSGRGRRGRFDYG